jgi:ABC-type phosphate transport system substrate-binding protein
MNTRAAVLILAAAALMTVGEVAAAKPGFVVVINESNPISSVNTEQLARCFMKELGTWSTGDPVVPVDQAASSPVREAFSKAVHGRDVAAVKSFWQRQIFSGNGVPPAELATDAEVLDFVRANPGAIGYVAASTPLGGGVKVLPITD